MKRYAFVLMLGLLALPGPSSEKVNSHLYYAQLIRGTDSAAPVQPHWKPIGSKLSHRLSPLFRWKHYWEVNRLAIAVEDHKPRKARLSSEREVEILLQPPKIAEVRLYRNGELQRASRQRLDTAMFIMGGERTADEAWFVVVRRDKPETAPHLQPVRLELQ
jgi:hypothetical protein